MADLYQNSSPGFDSPFASHEEADFSSTDYTFTNVPRAIYVVVTNTSGGSATLRLNLDGSDLVMPFAQGVHLFPGRVKIVRNSGTTNIARIFGVGGKG